MFDKTIVYTPLQLLSLNMSCSEIEWMKQSITYNLTSTSTKWY